MMYDHFGGWRQLTFNFADLNLAFSAHVLLREYITNLSPCTCLFQNQYSVCIFFSFPHILFCSAASVLLLVLHV